MPKITFTLKDPKAKTTAIQLLFTCSDGRLKYYTGEQTDPKTWPETNKGTKAVLRRIESHIEGLIIDHKVKGMVLKIADLRASLDLLLNKVEKGDTFDMMTAVMSKMASGQILTPTKKRYSPGSLKTFRFTISLLKRFDTQLPVSPGIEYYHRFIHWMQSKGYSTNYIGSQIKNWKTLGKLIGGDLTAFKKIQEETYDIYLTESELAKMYSLDLSRREAVVRDWFILDCYTGLRVSDLKLLTDQNYSNGLITIANEKTDEKVVIPAHKYVKEIIEKYGSFPPPVSDIEINRTIKKVAQKAEIKDRVLFTITKGGRREDTYMEKWEMVSCHTARRSFVTNLRKNGVADSIVMKLTGIKSPATLRRYDKLTSEEAADIAKDLKFFS